MSPPPLPPPGESAPLEDNNGNGKGDSPPAEKAAPETSCIQVFIRVRPLNAKESRSQCLRHFHPEGDREVISVVGDRMLAAKDPGAPRMFGNQGPSERTFSFDTVFDQHVHNDDVYRVTARELVDRVLDGYNSTCFAYGMTGAGKTYTMMGALGIDADIIGDFTRGIYTLSAEDIFAGAAQREEEKGCSYDISVSFLEIYNEQIQDLLQPGKKGRLTNVMEDPIKGVFVPGLSEHSIMQTSDLHDIIRIGNSRRKMAPTGGNEVSSRSHAILQLSLTRHDSDGEIHTSKFSLIDLAGSERAKATDIGSRGTRMQEHASINRSLLALANVINILSDSRKKGSFVPYRDSKLTRLLKDSLGGNTRTVMIANVSPACSAYDETLNTLKYASRARNIQAKLVRNTLSAAHHIGEYKRIIQSLRAEVLQLREQLAGGGVAAAPLRTSPRHLHNASHAAGPVHHQRAQSAAPTLSSNSVISTDSTHHHGNHAKNAWGSAAGEDDRLTSNGLAGSQDELTPLNLEITRTLEERGAVENELRRQRTLFESDSDTAAFESLSRTLLELFEEKMEIKGSLVELRDLNAHNEKEVVKLREMLSGHQRSLVSGDLDENEAVRTRDDMQAAMDEIANIERNTRENEGIRTQLEQDLQRTEDAKTDLQNQILKLKVGNRRSFMALQVQVHELKLENLDLETKNLQLQKELVLSQQDTGRAKERTQQLEAELRRMRLMMAQHGVGTGNSSPRTRSNGSIPSARRGTGTGHRTTASSSNSATSISDRTPLAGTQTREDRPPLTASQIDQLHSGRATTRDKGHRGNIDRQSSPHAQPARRKPSTRPAVVPPLPLDSSGLLIGRGSTGGRNDNNASQSPRRVHSARSTASRTTPRNAEALYASSISARAAANKSPRRPHTSGGTTGTSTSPGANGTGYPRTLSPRRTGTHGMGQRTTNGALSPRRSARGNKSPGRAAYPATVSTHTSTVTEIAEDYASVRRERQERQEDQDNLESPRAANGYRSPRRTPREAAENRAWQATILRRASDIQRQLAENPPRTRVQLTPRGTHAANVEGAGMEVMIDADSGSDGEAAERARWDASEREQRCRQQPATGVEQQSPEREHERGQGHAYRASRASPDAPVPVRATRSHGSNGSKREERHHRKKQQRRSRSRSGSRSPNTKHHSAAQAGNPPVVTVSLMSLGLGNGGAPRKSTSRSPSPPMRTREVKDRSRSPDPERYLGPAAHERRRRRSQEARDHDDHHGSANGHAQSSGRTSTRDDYHDSEYGQSAGAPHNRSSAASSVRVIKSVRSPRAPGPKLESLMLQLQGMAGKARAATVAGTVVDGETASGGTSGTSGTGGGGGNGHMSAQDAAVGHSDERGGERHSKVGIPRRPSRTPPARPIKDSRRSPPRTLQELQLKNDEVLQRFRRSSVGNTPPTATVSLVGRDRTTSEPSLVSTTPRAAGRVSPTTLYEEALQAATWGQGAGAKNGTNGKHVSKRAC